VTSLHITEISRLANISPSSTNGTTTDKTAAGATWYKRRTNRAWRGGLPAGRRTLASVTAARTSSESTMYLQLFLNRTEIGAFDGGQLKWKENLAESRITVSIALRFDRVAHRR